MLTETENFAPITSIFSNPETEEKRMNSFRSISLYGEAVQGQVLVFDEQQDGVARVSHDAFDKAVGIAYIPEPEKEYRLTYSQPMEMELPLGVRRHVDLEYFGLNKVAYITTGIIKLRAGNTIAEGRQVICSSNGTVVLDNGVSYALPGSVIGTALENGMAGREIQVKLHIGIQKV